MPARYMRKSVRASRLWILTYVVLALVVGTIIYFWMTQGRFPLALTASQAGSEPVSSQQNSTAGIPSALESPASVDSGSPSFAVMNTLTYINREYSFTFALPQDLEGYTTLNEKWGGTDIKNTASKVQVFKGLQITIRDPRWISQVPRRDIPITILTVDQWNQLQNGEFPIGAAPINPSKLSQNSKYVFALLARYSYAFSESYEEMRMILDGSPLATFEPTSGKQA